MAATKKQSTTTTKKAPAVKQQAAKPENTVLAEITAEQKELTVRIDNLSAALSSPDFKVSDNQRDLLTRQLDYMRRYAAVLDLRIADLT